ncbi:asparagine synthase (glutamine-hydrolyzing) [Azospirillum isscasi]|uniref:asparagine synthase (glutamine-hydrolyzing) n=1 Tax=Azospirillum isscasi TaxID=3053926 RepID=A0ABU0WK59_9PROT|nr:asparagine synthase (glutamine-hydrolyzing) [Azospirillum isscasi]MDQ2104242.1 asparagine synthase (glutamine-hydrolyzing) [Azospirillum isscasi]
MCGIAGVLRSDGRKADPAELEGMAAMLRSRGPDGWSMHVDGGLGLVHTRLPILDVSSAGDQPMAALDGRFWISFNGEIYNFLELREELLSLGWTFQTRSDTEVLLKSFIQWGPACQLKLNGMWAFAVWDAVEKRIFLSRDRFGVKPLHYAWTGRDFAFGSVMKAFLPLSWIDWTVDANALAVAIAFPSRLEGTQDCLFRAIRRLPAGHCLTLQAGGSPRLERWWNTLDHLPATPLRYEEQREQVRALFLDACRIRLRSDVPVATALSGGIDSSAVHCAIAHLAGQGSARTASDWQRAYVADYPDSLQSERPYAEAVIRSAGTRGIFQTIHVDEVVANADQAIFDIEDIIENASAPWLLYRRMRQDGVVVSLDGHGGDELFVGYTHQLASAITEIRDERLRAEYQRTLEGFAVPGYSPGRAGAWDGRSALLRTKPEPPALPGRDSDLERFGCYDPLTRCLYADLHFTTLPTILRNFDRCSMAHGVEIRAPFMDWRLVCLAFALPPASKVRDGYSKYILRDALSDILPREISGRRQKLGFVTPVFDWLKGPFGQYMLDVVGSAGFLQSPFWDGPRIRALVEESLREGYAAGTLYFWPFIHAARLLDQFQSVRGAPSPTF